jgi:hypothetical protein
VDRMTNELFRILLVEDNPSDVFLFRAALEHAKVNCELIVLSDGQLAMEFFCQGRSESFPPGRSKRGPLLPYLGGWS